MPELPEVETIRRQLSSAGVAGRRIEQVRVRWERTVAPLSSETFCSRVCGRTLLAVDRVGKWLVFRLDGPENLLVHLRMTGGFYLAPGGTPEGAHDRAVFHLSGGLQLHFRDPRKFGRLRLAPAPEGVGPDALCVSACVFRQRVCQGRRSIKAALLDQSRIAGIGNIYADEALFEAGIHPLHPAGSMDLDVSAALCRAVRKVLRAGVRNGGTSLGSGRSNYTDLNGKSGGHREQVKVYGRAGEPCVACGYPLQKTTVAQRTTVFCPHCQPQE